MEADGDGTPRAAEDAWLPADVQRLRARSSAILTGSGTVLADDPALTVRMEELGGPVEPQPRRVVVDSALKTSPSARIVAGPGGCLLVHAGAAEAERLRALRAAGADVLGLSDERGRVDLRALLQHLAGLGMNEILVEAGAGLAGAVVQQGLADELWLYVAPKLMGDAARGLMSLPGLERMSDSLTLTLEDVRVIGQDLRLIYRSG